MLLHCAPSETSRYAAWDCSQCRDPQHAMYLPVEVRRTLHCGWMDESEWVGEGGPQGISGFGDEPYKERVCPGYLMAQPLIGEILEAHKDYEKGNWGAMRGDAPNVICEGVRAFDAALESFKAWRSRTEAEKRKREAKG